MSELKPCPFCGKEPAIDNNFAICVNDDCELSDYWSGLEDCSWNTRPIEDALTARIAELEEELEHVIEVGNYGWDVIRKYGWEEKEINWWNTASDKAYNCLRKGK